MNRRGFLGSLLAAPIAAVMGWKSKGPVGFWGHEIVKRHRPTMTPLEFSKALGESTDRMVSEMSASAEAAGESFSMSKGLVGCKNILGRKGT